MNHTALTRREKLIVAAVSLASAAIWGGLILWAMVRWGQL